MTTAPTIGQMHDDVQDTRSVAIDRYVMIYRPIDGGIAIRHALHGARDIVATLRQD